LSRTIITEASLIHLPALSRLFAEAVRVHFAYFPAEIQDRLIREHGLYNFAKAVIHPRRIVLVARQGRRIIGYALGHVPESGEGQLYWLYVDPAHRGQNTGLSLLSRMLKTQGRKGAHQVMLATHDHRRYYERQGFIFVENQQVDGVPMAVMTFRLGSPHG
jgi:N-acetylglutamate synthase-like GNAT family acetyltransferase